MKRHTLAFALILIPLFIFCKDKGGDKPSDTKIRLVSASGGLNMRDKPDASGALVATIPDWVKVDAFEEAGNEVTIGGITGKWTKVKWNDKTGWVFGGFLKPGPVSQHKGASGPVQTSPEEIKKKKDMYLRLEAAMHEGKNDQMAEILKGGADPNYYPPIDHEKGYEARYEPLLIIAARGCRYEQARVLMEYGANVNVTKNYSESINPDESIRAGITALDIVAIGINDSSAGVRMGCVNSDEEKQKFVSLLKKSGGAMSGVDKLYGQTR